MRGSRYDAVVIGGGHNGLTMATLLARDGRATLLVERREALGGLAAGVEFHPDYLSPGVLHDTSGLRQGVVEKLGLSGFGLELESEESPVLAPARAGEGDGILIWRDPARARDELARSAEGDADGYAGYRAFLDRIGPFLRRALDRVPPNLIERGPADLWELGRTALALRALGRKDMMELLRIAPMCVADWLGEWFGSDLLKAALAGPAVYGTWAGPWSPGTTANLLIAEGFHVPRVRGGAPALVASLERAARDAGVEIRTGSAVRSVNLRAGRVCAVVTDDGEVIATDLVAGACDPRHLFFDLLPSEHLSLRLQHGLDHFRNRGTTAKVDLALTGYPAWACRPEVEAEWVRIADGLDPLERAFDPVKYRSFGPDLALEIYVPTVGTTGMAPAGHHVFSVLAHFVPHDLDGGWTEERRGELLECVLATLERYAPTVRDSLVGCEVMTPADLEDRYALPGGHIHHGEHGLDQLLVRPTPECARYATPFPGLYLCGSGSYPGGGVTCAPGALAAERILA